MKILNPGGKVNLHTHTIYCDGKDEPEDMVLRAIELGFSRIGFSGHEYAPYDLDACMTPENTLKYRQAVLAAKEKYQGPIKVYLGIERDYYGPGDDYPYDYVIGSVHYVRGDGGLVCIDDTAERLERETSAYFGGDYRELVAAYYQAVADVVHRTGANIIGHFDLVTKFNEGNSHFDEQSRWYRDAALGALRSLSQLDPLPVLEINTGAMARGYRSRPYPDRYLIEEADRLGFSLILSSDCHDRQFLDYGFTDLLASLKT